MILSTVPGKQVKHQEDWNRLVKEIRQLLQYQSKDASIVYDISNTYTLPLHLSYLIITSIRKNHNLELEDISSVSYYAVCRDVLMPYKNKTYLFQRFFNIKYPYLKNTDQRLEWFLSQDNGLTLTQKVSLLEEETSYNAMGVGKQRFEQVIGRLNINATPENVEERRLKLYDGVWAAAVASYIKNERGDLTAAEVLLVGDYLARDTGTKLKLDIMTSLVKRMGKAEVYFLASQINKFHDHVSRTSSLLRAFSKVHEVEVKMLERLVSMHSMVDVASLVENDEILEQFEKILPFRTFRPMLAAKWKQEYKFPMYAEAKYDGVRLLVHKLGNKVICYSRRRKNYMYKYSAVSELSTLLPAFSVILDGEITALQWTATGAKYLNVYELHEAIQSGAANYRLIYVIFDVLYLNGQELVSVPYLQRMKLRHQLYQAMMAQGKPIGIEIREIETVKVHNKKELINIYNQYIQAGFEGAITKDPQGTYELGKRSPNWQKLKPKETLDVTITGIVPIQGTTGMRVWGLRYAYLTDEGAFEDMGMIRGIDTAAGTRLAELIVNRGLVVPNNQLVDLSSDLKSKSRFAQSKETLGFEITPDIVITIDSLGVVRKDGKVKLRNARFLHIREDKPVEEISSFSEIYNEYMRSP